MSSITTEVEFEVAGKKYKAVIDAALPKGFIVNVVMPDGTTRRVRKPRDIFHSVSDAEAAARAFVAGLVPEHRSLTQGDAESIGDEAAGDDEGADG